MTMVYNALRIVYVCPLGITNECQTYRIDKENGVQDSLHLQLVQQGLS